MKKNASPAKEAQDIRELYIDERTEKKIQEHLNNEDDVITEEDIANAPTGIVEGKELADPEELPEDKKEELEEEEEMLEEKKIKDNEDPDVDTAWNVLGS